jgi:F-type H+-transporting ATPase subunit gamma
VTDRLADISERINGIRQLGAVVNAMRGIAAARAQQARNQLMAVDSYTSTIAIAMGRGIALVPTAVTAPIRRQSAATKPATALVLFCAEQGFAGAFSERVLDSVGADLASCALFLIGTRGIALIAQRGVAARWTAAMPAHSPGIVKLADAIVEALYAGIASGEIAQLDAVFAQWQPGQPVEIQRRRLIPLDTTAFPRPRGGDAPLLNLSPTALLEDLTASYLHAEL